MVWILLVIAGLLEVAWAYAMKQSNGFTKLTPSIFTIVLMMISFGLLAYCMKTLPLGTAYAIWTGIGAVGAFIIGILVLGEAVTIMRIVSVCLIILGLVGLKLATTPTV
jgi:quaternary ammonium compound-resistance protein SugE